MTYTGRCRNLCLIIWYVFRRLSDTLGIDYQLQFKLLPLIATVYAFYAAGNFLINMYEDARSEIANNNFHLLPEVSMHHHACMEFLCYARSYMPHQVD